MASGIILVTNIPGWPSPSPGVLEQLGTTLTAAGFAPLFIAPDGLHVGDLTTAQNFLNTYAGSSIELQWNKNVKQAALDAFLSAHFDLIGFIKAGTLANLTGTNVGNFLASSCNNYRSIRATISAATTVAQAQAIDVTAGWPSNP